MSVQLRLNQLNGWASTEFGDAVFGDKRLTKRLVKLSDSLVNLPESSINQACGRWSETKAGVLCPNRRNFRNNIDNIKLQYLQ